MCARIPVCRCAASRVWFYPNTHRLHIIDGHGANSNNECPIAEELPVGVATRVRIVAETAQVSVYYDDVLGNCAIFWGTLSHGFLSHVPPQCHHMPPRMRMRHILHVVSVLIGCYWCLHADVTTVAR